MSLVVFMENTWQVFAINASCKYCEWEPAGRNVLWDDREPASIAKDISLHIPCMGVLAPLLTLLLQGNPAWVVSGRGGTTCKGSFRAGIPCWSNERETYSCFLGDNAPSRPAFSFAQSGDQFSFQVPCSSWKQALSVSPIFLAWWLASLLILCFQVDHEKWKTRHSKVFLYSNINEISLNYFVIDIDLRRYG